MIADFDMLIIYLPSQVIQLTFFLTVKDIENNLKITHL